MMSLTSDFVDEIHVLHLFDLSNHQEGIKVHHTAADKSAVSAAERLYSKGLITQQDGGYLTSTGLEAAENLEKLLIILNAETL